MRFSALAMFVAAGMAAGPAFGEEIAGDWKGSVAGSAGPVPVIVHILKGPSGGYAGSAELPASGAAGLQVEAIKTDGSALSFSVPSAGDGNFKAIWKAETKTWVGEWTQGGQSSVMTLSRAEK